MNRKLLSLIFAYAFLIIGSIYALAGCGHFGTDDNSDNPVDIPVSVTRVETSGFVITLTMTGFTPTILTVTVGTQVTWYNAAAMTRTLQSGEVHQIYLPIIICNGSIPIVPSLLSNKNYPPMSLYGGELFSGTLSPGTSFTYRFLTIGTFFYRTAEPPWFLGHITVEPESSGVSASPLEPGVATDIASATAFLYTGDLPIQTGVVSGTIEITRAAVLRGRVFDNIGNPISGTQITVLDHPEVGQTQSRVDGMFDMAVNGGGWLTVNYQKNGFLPAQRKLNVPWRDYSWLPDVTLIPLDPHVTAIDLNSSVLQVAQGSIVSDTDGMRQARLFILPGTQATLVFSNEMTQTLSIFHIRLTEYTVGKRGPQAMPGELPSQSAYTYAAEFSVDEAIAAGSQDVVFSQSVIGYLDNFLSFTSGISVPLGYHDRQKNIWVPSDSGRVIQILGVTNNLADLDTNGDDIVDDAPMLAVLGITDTERAKLAEIYPVGKSLWRMPTTHFSAWDANWGARCKNNQCEFPQDPDGQPEYTPDDPCSQAGSQIGCETQILGEEIEVVGTPFRLHYSSGRVPGYKAAYQLRIPLSGNQLPQGIQGINLSIWVAGQQSHYTFPAQANLSYTFTWDGKDAYGRILQGQQPIMVDLSYDYQMEYVATDRFGYNGQGLISADMARMSMGLHKRWEGVIGLWDQRAVGLGGWNLDVHHSYDPGGKVLYLGDGNRRSAQAQLADIITTVAGNGWPEYTGDDMPATQAQISPHGIAFGSDGSLYIADRGNGRIRRVLPSGLIKTVAGGAPCCIYVDGVPATQVTLNEVKGIAVGADGSIYITAYTRIHRVDSSGIITTVAGTGTWGYNGDGIPATQAQLSGPNSIVLGLDGSFYFAEQSGRVRRVGADGVIETVAGGGSNWGNGIPAAQAALYGPNGVAMGPDGSLYISEGLGDRIRRVGPDGIIRTVVGGGSGFVFGGVPATQAVLVGPSAVAVGSDGTLYIADANRVRLVGSDGIIRAFAGNGYPGFGGDGMPATQTQVHYPSGVAVGPDGGFYISSCCGDMVNRIRRIGPALPGFSWGDVVFPSEDGAELYQFDRKGRHLRTLEALTGAVLYKFGYDSAGRLMQVTDGDGNVTTIERDVNGNPTTIIGPYGQRTSLQVDANGYLARVTNPANASVQLVSTSDGLLTGLTDPRSNLHSFTYNEEGRLTRDDDPAGGSKTLSRITTGRAYSVTVTTALNRQTTYGVERLPTGHIRRTVIDPSGNRTETIIGMSSSQAITYTQAITYSDGTVDTLFEGPDPRWGMLAPVVTNFTRRTPSGLSINFSTQYTATFMGPGDWRLRDMTNTITINGRPYTTTYNGTMRIINMNSAAGRNFSEVLDAQGRVIQEQAAGLLPTGYTYDGRGRLVTVAQGIGAEARSLSVSYDSNGYVKAITDPLGRTMHFEDDAAGQPVTQTLPGGRIVQYRYDATENVTGVTPPGRPMHDFAYSPINLVTAYTPPAVPGVTTPATTYTYNADRQLIQVTRPDGQTKSLTYDSGGRLSTLTIPRGQVLLGYDPATGNLSRLTAPGGIALNFRYDGALLTSETRSGPLAGSVGRTYDNNWNITSRNVNGTNPIESQYDSDDLLVQAGALSLSRNGQNGLLLSTTLGSVDDTWVYNGFGEWTQYTASYNGAALYSAQVTRDNLGSIMGQTETVQGTTAVLSYTYDIAGRLAGVQKNEAMIAAYTYDSNDNRLTYTSPGGTINGVYDDQDRLILYGTTIYTYTANGELGEKRMGDRSTTYQYDSLGNLITVTIPNGTQIEYLIDGQNRRIGKKVNDTLVQGFLYQDGLKPIAELDGNGNVVSRFVYATRFNVPDYMIKGGVTYRFILNHLGSPRLVVNAITGDVVQRMDYDEFGHILIDTNPSFQPFGFAGGLYDFTTGLIHFGARDYDMEVGRWTSKDPMLFDDEPFNLYVYANNDPVNMMDYDGLTVFRVELEKEKERERKEAENAYEQWLKNRSDPESELKPEPKPEPKRKLKPKPKPKPKPEPKRNKPKYKNNCGRS